MRGAGLVIEHEIREVPVIVDGEPRSLYVRAVASVATRLAWNPCPACNTSGNCSACNGTGQQTRPPRTCPACAGSGNCSACGGSGQLGE